MLNSWLIAHFLTYYKIVLNLKSCDSAPESLILKILSLYFCKNNSDIFYIPYLQEQFININWSNMFGADKNKTVKIVQLQAFPHENHLSLFMYAHHTPIDQAAERIIVRTSLAHSPSQH